MMSTWEPGDALQCVDCAETDRLFHSVAGQRDAAQVALGRVEALCVMAIHMDRWVDPREVRAALSDGGTTEGRPPPDPGVHCPVCHTCRCGCLACQTGSHTRCAKEN